MSEIHLEDLNVFSDPRIYGKVYNNIFKKYLSSKLCIQETE